MEPGLMFTFFLLDLLSRGAAHGGPDPTAAKPGTPSREGGCRLLSVACEWAQRGGERGEDGRLMGTNRRFDTSNKKQQQ